MNQKNVVKLLAVASNFIFELLIGVGLGYFLGRYLDGLWDTSPVITSILMVVFALFVIILFMRRIYLIGQRHE
jgi:F0F1-type ATP synthase assembly protein I